MKPFVTRAWGTPNTRRSWIEHMTPDYESEASSRSMEVVEQDSSERVVLFDADDKPCVVEPWSRKAGFK